MRFLSPEEVLSLHEEQIALHGGATGVRSSDLLYSAIAQPEAGFGGQYLHESIWDMAAAYAYHLALNHPFVDGNKRTALKSALTFLDLNGYALAETDRLVDLMVEIAEGKMEKPAIAMLLKQLHLTRE